jgi:uncharacterized membrane protein
MSFAFVMVLVILLSVVFAQSTRVFYKHANHVGAATAIAQICGAACCFIWYWFFPRDTDMPQNLWFLLILACVFYTLADRYGGEVRKHLDVSVFTILNKSTDAFLIIFSILIFHQMPSIYKFFSAILIIIGQIALSYKKGKFIINKYFAIALGTSLCYAIAFTIDIGISNEINLPLYVAITLSIPAFLIILVERISLKQLKSEYNSLSKLPLALVGVSWGSLIIISLYAYQFGNIISVVVINAFAVVINVLIGIFIQKERENIRVKILASVLVAIGVAITVFS